MIVDIPISDVLSKALGKELAKARIDAEKTQVEVAEAASISPNYLGQLENGRMPSFDALRTVCKVLKVTPVALAKRIAGNTALGTRMEQRAEALQALFAGLEEVL